MPCDQYRHATLIMFILVVHFSLEHHCTT